MSAIVSPPRSKVVIHDSLTEPVVGVAVELLGVLGHDVSLVRSAEAAIASASEVPTDLLVLGVTDPAEQGQCLERLALLPKSKQPKQVAILSDDDAESGVLLQRKLPGVKVHVFVKPVHALGLFAVIKRMNASN